MIENLSDRLAFQQSMASTSLNFVESQQRKLSLTTVAWELNLVLRMPCNFPTEAARAARAPLEVAHEGIVLGNLLNKFLQPFDCLQAITDESCW